MAFGSRPTSIWGVQQHWVAMGLAHCCGYFFSLLLCLASGVLLVCLVIHFLPHLRTLFYQEATCTVLKTVYTVQYSCGCVGAARLEEEQEHHSYGDNCHSFYPCLLVYVLVNSSSAAHLDPDTKEQLRWPVLAYEDDWQQIAVYRADEGSVERCSKYACVGGTRTNRDVIERYRLEMAVRGQQHQCWFDGSNLLHKGAAFKRNIASIFIFHVLFWPVFFLLAGIVVFLIVCCMTRRRRYASNLTRKSDYMSASDTVIVNMEEKY